MPKISYDLLVNEIKKIFGDNLISFNLSCINSNKSYFFRVYVGICYLPNLIALSEFTGDVNIQISYENDSICILFEVNN